MDSSVQASWPHADSNTMGTLAPSVVIMRMLNLTESHCLSLTTGWFQPPYLRLQRITSTSSIALVRGRREFWFKVVSEVTGNVVMGDGRLCLHVRWLIDGRQWEFRWPFGIWNPCRFGEHPELRMHVPRHHRKGQEAESTTFGSFPARQWAFKNIQK